MPGGRRATSPCCTAKRCEFQGVAQLARRKQARRLQSVFAARGGGKPSAFRAALLSCRVDFVTSETAHGSFRRNVCPRFTLRQEIVARFRTGVTACRPCGTQQQALSCCRRASKGLLDIRQKWHHLRSLALELFCKLVARPSAPSQRPCGTQQQALSCCRRASKCFQVHGSTAPRPTGPPGPRGPRLLPGSSCKRQEVLLDLFRRNSYPEDGPSCRLGGRLHCSGDRRGPEGLVHRQTNIQTNKQKFL